MRSSAAGSTFSEYYGVNGNIGRAIMIIASLATVQAEPGDVFLIPAPYYSSFVDDINERAGVIAVGVPCDETLDRNAFEAAYERVTAEGRRVRAVLFSSHTQSLLRALLQSPELEGVMDLSRQRLKTAYEIMAKGLADIGVPTMKAQAGIFIMADFSAYMDKQEFAEEHVLYALLFPLYQAGHFILAAAASAAVALIARLFCRDVTEEVEIPEEPVTTGNPELDQMIADGDGAIKAMRALNDSIQDETISRQIDRLEEVSSRIFQYVKDNPAKLPQIRKFMSYYLPTTIKLLTAYDQMSRQGVSGENITGTMEKVEGMMSTIVRAFEKQLDSLFGDEAMDISTDITVLENMMVREGLASDDLHKAAQSTPQTQPPQDTDGGITLEL